ncbi:hypothetical protein ACFLUW_02115 [Chloroflexota bacterium]
MFSRFLYGSRPYVEAGLIAIGTATVIGLLMGFLSAGTRGKTDSILRMAIFTLSLLILLVVLVTFLSIFVRVFVSHTFLPIMASAEHPELATVIIGVLLSFVLLPSVYTTTRKAFFSASNANCTPSSEEGKIRRAFNFRTFRQGLAPLLPLSLVNLGVTVGLAVMVIAPISYYGFGVPPPLPEWGNMLSGT